MSWMSQLYDTYENNIGIEKKSGVVMTPIAHMNVNAHLEITIDMDGNFIAVSKVDKEDANTLIPVTESSAGRSSGKAPHILSDTLSYIAGDFGDYCEKEKDKKNAEEKFEKYIEQLKKWTFSDYTNPKVQAIYKYLSKRILVSDMVKAGIITQKDDKFLDDKKISGQAYEKVMVRFRVLDGDKSPTDCTWNDTALIRAYTDYFLSEQNGQKDICYLTGRIGVRTDNHPKGIVDANYGAKLISANDNQGYTYRGRFLNADQAYSLSYEASQKIHSALTWLVKNQGAYVGTKVKRFFVCWNPKGKELPDIFEEFNLVDDNNSNNDSSYKKKLYKSLLGYSNQFSEEDFVNVIGLEAATTGRLSITYYNEMFASDFFGRIREWGETCNWKYLKFTEQKTPYYKTETPTFRRIVECAFGYEQNGFIGANDKVLKEHVQRLMKCMLEKQAMPRDIVHAVYLRASMPMAYSHGNRERVLSTACAVIVKYYIDKGIMKGEEDEMKLDVRNQDRSYLFGRLLAVLEKVERATYERGESREPNAIRLQAAYVNHPFKTWMILEDVLKPYFQKLKPGSREYYRRLISEITELFSEDNQQLLNQGLSEMYLLGYYLQRAELNQKNEDKEEVNNG
jgi:CRISPR-associated protein Csd1